MEKIFYRHVYTAINVSDGALEKINTEKQELKLKYMINFTS